MDAQGSSREVGKTPRDKFPEPRGWALNWGGFHEAGGGSILENSTQNSDGSWEKFPEPRGWAAQWDGSVLSDLQRR